MYYEIHGPDHRPGHAPGGVPLVLLHGSLGSLDMFRGLLPALSRPRQVILIDQQAHGRTADIDRPLRYEQMAEDTAALLRYLAIDQADFCGFSMGAATALHLAMRHPDLVQTLVLLGGISLNDQGIYPEVMAGLTTYFTPEAFAGSPIEAEYRLVAPNPEDFPMLVRKVQALTRDAEDIPVEAVRAIAAPTMIILGDSDILRPEAAVELFRLRGGGVPGDFAGLPPAQLAVLPGTTHIGLIGRTEWLPPMIQGFLDAAMPAGWPDGK
jgi:pimeloyl-ACP methyl ester carboxylesterase